MKRATSSSAFSLAASCWLLLALVATPCSGARAALDRPGRGGAEGGQPEPLRLEDGLLLVHEQADSNKTNSGRHKAKSGAPPEVIKTKRGSSKKSRSTASDAYTPRRNVAPAGHDHSDDHPRPLHRHNDLFVPALERRGGGGSSGYRDRQKTSPPPPVAVTTDDLHGGLHHNQPERERTSRNLRGSSGNPRARSD